ncbi:glycosyltransferase family 4 protein [Variovorax sp. dw_308]|uniref:glycosyltransferase family 4 protein n=1 Tax=Variovorax sp. dw_308 TaxID=2721546 RepID=UPI001C4688CE|nr:glycosyltransferase family 4 protein [Variovorax sp. dw_308]
MPRIAYVDHSYHRTTRSTHFLRDILRRHGQEVQDFWDEAWQGGPSVEWASVRHHDVIIMFQSYCPLPGGEAFRLLHPNVVFIPMLDNFAISRGPVFNLTGFWAPFQGSKVLNFSSTLHGLTTSYGVASHWARFYQPAEPVAPSPPARGLHGFFWLRCEDQINWALLRQLIGGSRFDSFHLHLAGDPGAPEPRLPPAADMARHRITTSTWFEDRRELTALVERANVYFAPRLEEGIGQSFLEAMARGKCVVAPNQGTMNEYILHGVNGLLYEHHNPRPLDFSRVKRLGRCARDSVVAGHAQWLAAEDGIVDFILTPSERFYVGKYQHVFAAPAATNPSAPVLAAETLGSSLRALTGRYALLRATRPVWHPLLRLTRRVRRMIRGA